MPVYPYFCQSCGYTEELVLTIDQYAHLTYYPVCTCTDPPTPLTRKFSFAATPMFVPHHNASTGQWVNNMSELKSQMAEASDAATARTGIPHNFVPTETGDLTPPTLLN